MEIPDDVFDLAGAARSKVFRQTGSRRISMHAEYEVIAEWARKEALLAAWRLVQAQRLAFVRNDAERAWEHALDAAAGDILMLTGDA